MQLHGVGQVARQLLRLHVVRLGEIAGRDEVRRVVGGPVRLRGDHGRDGRQPPAGRRV